MVADGKDIIQRLRRLSTPNISDAMDRLGLRGAMTGLSVLDRGMPRLAGRARTVLQGPRSATAVPGQGYARHIDLVDSALEPDDVPVIAVTGGVAASSWGYLLSLRSRARRAAGVVVDGTVRDPSQIVELGFPTFSRRDCCSAGTKLRVETLAVDAPIICGGVHVSPGDFIVGDDSGVVVIPPSAVAEVIAAAQAVEDAEEQLARRLTEGGTFKETGSYGGKS
ncbi:hypothetical protein [Bosea sp. (in: a-proteobacteria)]|uniref:RraA family protein n=1 Tax=Bosea sp. (in: a-proteobacteria) TaxID=1871050 RepID=UPI0026115963|nr:hypothetical protein [Bosea sp. (in: a-proteobacteria)]MCO5090213.1 hypothetical protein [Bosea sp. (in: a-proteobacteria)]